MSFLFFVMYLLFFINIFVQYLFFYTFLIVVINSNMCYIKLMYKKSIMRDKKLKKKGCTNVMIFIIFCSICSISIAAYAYNSFSKSRRLFCLSNNKASGRSINESSNKRGCI